MDKLKVIIIQKELLRRKVSIFSLTDFVRIFKANPKTARAFLSYQSKQGAFLRLKRGVYVFNGNLPTKFETANYLLKPSYISFETALSFYNIIPENVYTITSATTKSTKEYNFQNQIYQFYQIKKNLFFGYKPLRIQNKVVLLAEPEKALLDYLYILSLKKQDFSERLDLSKIDKIKLNKYLSFFNKSIRKSGALNSLLQKTNL